MLEYILVRIPQCFHGNISNVEIVNGAIAAKEDDKDVGLSGTLFFMALQAIMAVRNYQFTFSNVA